MATDEESEPSLDVDVPRPVPDFAIEGALDAAAEEDASYAVVASDADFQLADSDEELREAYVDMKSSRDHLTPEELGFSLVVVDLE